MGMDDRPKTYSTVVRRRTTEKRRMTPALKGQRSYDSMTSGTRRSYDSKIPRTI
jgi:hypothetical protein